MQMMSHTFDIKAQAAMPNGTPSPCASEENGPWIYGPFPAVVKGLDEGGRRFKAAAALESLCVGYCNVRVEGRPEPGARLSVATRINRAVVILRGTVVGVLALAGGARSVAVRITRYRFVHQSSDSN